MCLLIVAGKGTDKYSELLLNGIRTASITNTDGAGFSFKRASTKKVFISKGYKYASQLIEGLRKYKLKPEDELIVHQRIGNKGAKNTDMNHPFVLSDDKDTILLNNKYVNFPTIAHNGTIHNHSKHNSEFSDTYWFIQEFMYHPAMIDLLVTDIKFFKEIFSIKLSTNKLAFLFPNEDTNVITLGEFKEVEGYLFSNDSYKDKTIINIGGVNNYNRGSEDYSVSRYSNQRYLNFNDCEWDDDDDDDVAEYHLKRKLLKEKNDALKASDKIEDSLWKFSNKKNDDIVLDSSFKTSICADTKVTFKLFMDMWVPDKYKNETQFSAIRFNLTIFNYMDFTLQSVADDHDLGVRKNCYYEVINFDTNFKREGEVLHTIRIKMGTEAQKSKLLYIPQYEITRLFKTIPAKSDLYEKYRGFYNLCNEQNQSKNEFKRLSKRLALDKYKVKENPIYKGTLYKSVEALNLYYNLLAKHLFPQDYLKIINSKSITTLVN